MSGFRTDKIRNFLTVFFLFVIAGGLFFYLERQKQKDLEQASGVVTQVQSQGNSDASDDEDVGEDDSEAEETALALCDEKSESPAVGISHERFLGFLRAGEAWIPATAATSCYRSGQSVTVFERFIDSNIVYLALPRGKAKIASIEERKVSELRGVAKYLTTPEEIKAIRRGLNRRKRLTGERGRDMTVKMLQLKSESWFETRQTYGAPFAHPGARTLSLDEFKAALKRGVVPYDVRPAEIFKVDSVVGAANLPANEFNREQFTVQSPSQLSENDFYIDTRAIRGAKRKPIIVFSSCGGDFLSYNAITYLRMEGFRRIGWFRGGYENWKTDGQGCGTPTSVTGVSIVTADEVRRHLDDGTNFLFVNGGFNLSGYEIKNSKNVVYEQKYFADMMASFRPVVWDEQKFKASGDSVDLDSLKLDPNTPVIVYGRFEFDWRPLKTAFLLKARGFKSVSWYRMGVEDWINHAMFNAEKYPTTPEYVRK